jgi:aerobic-type carbon monoxide dehydrogenase small subunit (CoxS/CutS family)
MVMATISLLRRLPNPTDQGIARVMDRNVCRCGTCYSGSLDQR